VLSKVFLITQGKCCGKKCVMCPYTDKHNGTSTKVRKEIIDTLEKWEKEELNLFISNR
tara:strand:- start:342 stop:515 length:174 start_codon:yes stop_codon:yes gene_type:complete